MIRPERINQLDGESLSTIEIDKRRMQSYFGWLKFCNSKNPLRKIQRDTGLRFSNWDGKKSNISRFYNKYIHIVDIVRYS